MWRRLALGVLVCCVSLGTVAADAAASGHRSRFATREFQRLYPCPSTGRASGGCPGYWKDHVIPLACGGADSVANLQWQTIVEARAKDKWERRGCGRRRS